MLSIEEYLALDHQEHESQRPVALTREPNKRSLTELLHDLIAQRFPVTSDLAHKADLYASTVSRFVKAERGLPLSTVDKIWPHLRTVIKPTRLKNIAKGQGFEAMFRQAVDDLDVPYLTLADASGVPDPTIWRFMRPDDTSTSMKLTSADKIWPFLWIEIWADGVRVDINPE